MITTTSSSVQAQTQVNTNKQQSTTAVNNVTADESTHSKNNSNSTNTQSAVTDISITTSTATAAPSTSKLCNKEELSVILNDCLQHLTDKDHRCLFAYPSDASKAQSLTTEGKMDLATIRIKIERNKYRNINTPSTTNNTATTTTGINAIDTLDSDVHNMVKSFLALCTDVTQREVIIIIIVIIIKC